MKTQLTLFLITTLAMPLLAQDQRSSEPPRIPPQSTRPEGPAAVPGEPRPPERPRRSFPELRREWRTPDSRPPSKPTPFLGVVTSHVSPALGAQLGLGDGFGLVVDEVLPDTPAANAGVQRHDVLTLFNDQQLVDPAQLATLIRARGKDAEVALTLLRHGKEQKVTVKIGERNLPDRRPFLGEDFRRNFDTLPESVRDSLRPLQDVAKDFRDRMRDFQQRFREWQKNPGSGPAPEVPQLDAVPDRSFGPRSIDVLREARPGGATQIQAIAPQNTTIWNTSQARIFLKDDAGEIELSSENGHRTLTARNAKGEIIFAGAVDSDEQRRALPEHIRKKIEKMEVTSTAEKAAEQRGTARIGGETSIDPPLEKEVQ